MTAIVRESASSRLKGTIPKVVKCCLRLEPIIPQGSSGQQRHCAQESLADLSGFDASRFFSLLITTGKQLHRTSSAHFYMIQHLGWKIQKDVLDLEVTVTSTSTSTSGRLVLLFRAQSTQL